MPRAKTNSITHLVKIVAEEVYNEKFGNLDRLRERIVKLENKKYGPILMDYSEIIDRIRSDLAKAGYPIGFWSDAEDALLIDEIKTAISNKAIRKQITKIINVWT